MLPLVLPVAASHAAVPVAVLLQRAARRRALLVQACINSAPPTGPGSYMCN
jgi:hypothetical protein